MLLITVKTTKIFPECNEFKFDDEQFCILRKILGKEKSNVAANQLFKLQCAHSQINAYMPEP